MNRQWHCRTLQSVLAILAVGLFAVQPAAAQEANFPSGGAKPSAWSDLPDWDGLWERGGDIVWDDSLPPGRPGEPQIPPYNDQYMKQYQAQRAAARAQAIAGRGGLGLAKSIERAIANQADQNEKAGPDGASAGSLR